MLDTPNCFSRKCKHYIGVSQSDGTEMTEVNICKAFLKGIPDMIAYGSERHDIPLENQDNDIVFEKK